MTDQEPEGHVHPGSFCSVPGATGKFKTGREGICSAKNPGDRLRWRASGPPPEKKTTRRRRAQTSPLGVVIPDEQLKIVLAAPQTDDVQHVTEVGSDHNIMAASVSCTCGQSKIITFARPTGEPVAVRLAGIHGANHEKDPARYPLTGETEIATDPAAAPAWSANSHPLPDLDAENVPVGVVIYCDGDGCDSEFRGDFTGPDATARYAAARTHLALHEGWEITNEDRCPKCKKHPQVRMMVDEISHYLETPPTGHADEVKDLIAKVQREGRYDGVNTAPDRPTFTPQRASADALTQSLAGMPTPGTRISVPWDSEKESILSIPTEGHRPSILQDRIRDAYHDLSFEPGSDVMLTRLRERFPDVPRQEFDQALEALLDDADVELEPEDNQKTLRQADWDASIMLGGERRHLLSMGKRAAYNHSWSAYGVCPDCQAAAGRPCWDLRTYGAFNTTPHPGRS